MWIFRDAVLDALTPLGKNVCGGEGAIYFWAKLPAGKYIGISHNLLIFHPAMHRCKTL